METEQEYNGWSNKATWAFKLHIDNNEGDYNYWRDETKTLELHELAVKLEEWFNEVFDSVIEGETVTEEAKSMVKDVGNGHDINWREVADSLKEEQHG